MTRAYHGPHVGPLQADHEKLVWLKPLPRTDRVRVRQHTCECREDLYELCASGGLMFIRRTMRRTRGTFVHETERWLSRRAAEAWALLMTGQVR